MNKIYEKDILEGLQDYIVPYLDRDLVSAKAIKQISIENYTVKITVVLGFPINRIKAKIIQGIKTHLMRLPAVQAIEVDLSWKIEPHQVQNNLHGIPQVKNVIAIASGKGGVGKSTTAVNLALALTQEGARVGILDADIYGPNQPHMLGVQQKPEVNTDNKLQPVIAHGLQTMSIGYLVDTQTPTIWRGPMVSSALQQLLGETVWDELDYLIIDMPPGTGDIQLTLAQKIPVSGAIIVTTPQDVALLDARKGLEMFRKVKVSVLGIIENMNCYKCSQCGHEEPLFGTGGGQRIADDSEVPLLGTLPLALEIREGGDQGCPIVAANATNPITNQYREIAIKLAAKLSLQPINHTSKFPKIVVE